MSSLQKNNKKVKKRSKGSKMTRNYGHSMAAKIGYKMFRIEKKN